MNDEASDSQVKLAINELIWTHGPKKMTLEEAEELAVYIFEKLRPVAAAGV